MDFTNNNLPFGRVAQNLAPSPIVDFDAPSPEKEQRDGKKASDAPSEQQVKPVHSNAPKLRRRRK